MGAVKAALEKHSLDVEAAAAALRREGAAIAAKRASTRDASEGLVGAVVGRCGSIGAMVELRCETDFVARTTRITELLRELCNVALINEDADLNNHPLVGDAAGALREVIRIERVEVVRGKHVAAYLHAGTPGAVDTGRIGVLVAVDGMGNRVENVGQRVAMHIAAAAPVYVSRNNVDEEVVIRERDALRDGAMTQGKGAQVVERIVEGKMAKWFSEVCLLEQEMLVECDGYDGKTRTVADSIDSQVSGCTVTDFARFSIP